MLVVVAVFTHGKSQYIFENYQKRNLSVDDYDDISDFSVFDLSITIHHRICTISNYCSCTTLNILYCIVTKMNSSKTAILTIDHEQQSDTELVMFSLRSKQA